MLTNGKRRYQPQSLLRSTKKLVNFGPLAPDMMWLMITYPKSTVRFLSMLMHLTSGHVTLQPREFQLWVLPNRTQVDSHWVLPEIS